MVINATDLISADQLYVIKSEQADKWNTQHEDRATEHMEIADIPNYFAVRCASLIPENGTVLEIGSANCRDLRYFIKTRNCKGIGLDISSEACEQGYKASLDDGTTNSILPIITSVHTNEIPVGGENNIDLFYARSALHMTDRELDFLFEKLKKMMKPGGYICVEGKTDTDPDISASKLVECEPFLRVNPDDYGNCHLRRVWNRANIVALVEKFDLKIIDIEEHIESKSDGTDAHFINFIAQVNKS